MSLLRSLALGAALSVIAMGSANATLISYNGYTHDTDTNIVTGGGLEWLQWDVTVGESINSIQSQLGTLEGGGWSIASNVQMAGLFNAFDFGLTYDSDENTGQGISTGFSVGEDDAEADRIFITMFGDTYAAGGASYCYGDECYQAAMALFGTDPDIDGLYNEAVVIDDYTNVVVPIQGRADITTDARSSDLQRSVYGVALVRSAAVPEPGTLALLGLGLIGLGFARQRKP